MVNYLNNYQSGENHYKLESSGEYEFKTFLEKGTTNDFECPECSEVLFTDETKAIQFLKGDK